MLITIGFPFLEVSRVSSHLSLQNMRLINAHTLALEEFFGASIPKYAILSHTWGSEEILLTDWTEIEALPKS